MRRAEAVCQWSEARVEVRLTNRDDPLQSLKRLPLGLSCVAGDESAEYCQWRAREQNSCRHVGNRAAKHRCSSPGEGNPRTSPARTPHLVVGASRRRTNHARLERRAVLGPFVLFLLHHRLNEDRSNCFKTYTKPFQTYSTPADYPADYRPDRFALQLAPPLPYEKLEARRAVGRAPIAPPLQ